MDPETPKKKRYKRITPDVVTRFRSQELIDGNGTAAIETLEPDRIRPDARAGRIRAKASVLQGAAYIDDTLVTLAKPAIERVNAMIQSDDEKIATKNAHFVIDHVRGKALQRTENKNYNLTIEAVLQ